MSTFSDVQALYGSVRDTWAKSQAHVVAHVVAAGVIFWMCGATMPAFPVPQLDPKQISDNEWFKLAKDTGIVYVSFVLPVVVVAAYVAVLRTAGQLLVAILMLISPAPSRRNRYRLVSSWVLEPLALTLGKADFGLGDVLTKSTELSIKYQSMKDAQWDVYQSSLGDLTKNAQIYLGDFLFFLLLWIAFFRLMPQAAWVHENEARFWPVAVILFGLALFGWFRVSRAIAVLPSLYLIYVSTMVRADPDMKSFLEVPEGEREKLRDKLEELLRKERKDADSRPSLLGFLKYRFGLRQVTASDEEPKRDRGLPFPSLYQQGLRFSRDDQKHSDYDNQWVSGYVAYLYYGLHRRLTQLAKALWQLARYLVTGAP